MQPAAQRTRKQAIVMPTYTVHFQHDSFHLRSHSAFLSLVHRRRSLFLTRPAITDVPMGCAFVCVHACVSSVSVHVWGFRSVPSRFFLMRPAITCDGLRAFV